MFGTLLKERGIKFETETKLVPGRKFRVDFFIPEIRCCVEIEGATWVKGGHSSGTGIVRDCEKLNLLQMNGYMTFRIPTFWFKQKLESVLEIVDFIDTNYEKQKPRLRGA